MLHQQRGGSLLPHADNFRPRKAEQGFVMPLCLVVIALLALSAATLSTSLQTATARAQLQQDTLNFEWSMHNLEQQVIWRSLLERAAINSQFQGQQVLAQVERELDQAGPWDTRSNPIEWRGLYDTEEFEAGRYKVIIQDARGLFDINYPSETYLSYALRTMNVPPSQRRKALEDIRTRVAEFAALRIVGDEEYRTTTVSGLSGMSDLCGLEAWSSIELCDSPTALAKYVTFGSGSLPNIKLTPDYLRDEMGVRSVGAGDAGLISDWERIQQREGFFDPLLASGAGGRKFHIWLHDQRAGLQRYFELDHSLDPALRPFRVSQRNEGAAPDEP